MKCDRIGRQLRVFVPDTLAHVEAAGYMGHALHTQTKTGTVTTIILQEVTRSCSSEAVYATQSHQTILKCATHQLQSAAGPDDERLLSDLTSDSQPDFGNVTSLLQQAGSKCDICFIILYEPQRLLSPDCHIRTALSAAVQSLAQQATAVRQPFHQHSSMGCTAQRTSHGSMFFPIITSLFTLLPGALSNFFGCRMLSPLQVSQLSAGAGARNSKQARLSTGNGIATKQQAAAVSVQHLAGIAIAALLLTHASELAVAITQAVEQVKLRVLEAQVQWLMGAPAGAQFSSNFSVSHSTFGIAAWNKTCNLHSMWPAAESVY